MTSSSAYVVTRNPASGAELHRYPAHDEAGVEQALADTHAASAVWAATPLDERLALLRGVGKLLTERRDEYAALITAEMGKPITEALGEIDKCAWNCEVVAELAPGWLADHEVASGASRSWLSYEPIGVVFAVMPWNFPFWQVLRFACTALAAGNAALLKHSPDVTGCALAIEELFADAGAPAGLFRSLVVPAVAVPEFSRRVVEDPRVAAVTLTGSERAGSSIASIAGAAIKKTVLELGGSDPFVVLADADVPAAAAAAVRSRFNNTGQSCVCAKRFVVHEDVAEEFVARFVEGVAMLQVGDPADPATTIGPMVRADLREGLLDQITRTVDEGLALVGRCRHRRSRLLRRADRARRRGPRHDGVRRGDVRAGRRDRPRPRRRPRGRARQRHDVRPRRLRLGVTRPRAGGRPADPVRRPVRERHGRLGPAAAVRWHRPQRLRPRAVRRGGPRVHQRADRGGGVRLDHVGLTVADLPAMTRWYAAALGLEVELEFALDHVEFRGVMLRSPDGYRVELLHRTGSMPGSGPPTRSRPRSPTASATWRSTSRTWTRRTTRCSPRAPPTGCRPAPLPSPA